jgi:hypothetical protein
MAEQLILGPVGEPRKRPPSPADEADAKALDRAVETMIQSLGGWDASRPLASLNRADLRKLANAAICGWILERAEMARCGDEAIGAELLSDAGFATQTLAKSLGREKSLTSTPNAAVSPHRRGHKK